MKIGIDIHGARGVISHDFYDPLTFPLSASAGQTCRLFCKIRSTRRIEQNVVPVIH